MGRFMTKKHSPPTAIAEAIALREAGFCLAVVAEHCGIPIRTLQTHFAKHGTRKGALTVEAIAEARKTVVENVLSAENVRDRIEMLIHSDLVHARQIRDKITIAIEMLDPVDTRSAALRRQVRHYEISRMSCAPTWLVVTNQRRTSCLY